MKSTKRRSPRQQSAWCCWPRHRSSQPRAADDDNASDATQRGDATGRRPHRPRPNPRRRNRRAPNRLPPTHRYVAAVASDLDTNGDGKVVFGIAAAGPADDGAYYQAVVDAAKTLSTENGFEEPIVVDNIQAADAATAIGDLAQQGVDVIIVGASEIAEPLPDLISRVPRRVLVLQLRRRLPARTRACRRAPTTAARSATPPATPPG